MAGRVEVLAPRMGPNSIEIAAHAPGKAFRSEIVRVFPLIDADAVIVVTTMQRGRVDLAGASADVEAEKDRLLEAVHIQFFE